MKIIRDNSKILAYLKKTEDTFVLMRFQKNVVEQNAAENFWLIVKSLKKSTNRKGYKLKGGDIIKLGRVKFRIRELASRPLSKDEQQFKGLTSPELNINNQIFQDSGIFEPQLVTKINLKDTHPESQCRICLQQETEASDYMVAPCGCTGSVRLVHLSCLQKWVRSRCSVKINGICTTYHWKNTSCEVCHKNLPDYLLLNGTEKFQLFDYPKMGGSNFIVLESISKETDNSKTLHVINTFGLKEPIKLGRGHECNIRIPDISVSRLHAFIQHSDGNYYLEDNSSKFGTLVLIKHPIVLDPDFNPAIQIGRTVLSFALQTQPQANS